MKSFASPGLLKTGLSLPILELAYVGFDCILVKNTKIRKNARDYFPKKFFQKIYNSFSK